MKVALSILFVLVGLSFFVYAAQDEHQLIFEFKRWMVQWNKSYADEVEFTYRYENFKNSIERIESLNAKSRKEGGATFGLNKFSDLSPQEFAEKYLMPARKPIEPRPEVPKIENPTLPASIDWRDSGAVTAVKNQEQCGSCWAFSTTEAIESSWILAGKGTNANTILSPQQIVDCDQSDDGCGGGNPPTAYQYVISAGGLDTEASYPYKAVDGKCNFKKADVGASIASWQYATTSRDESTLQSNLVSWGPLSICLDAAKWQDYTSGVMLWYQCAIFPILDHCVQLVGFNTNASTPYYMVRNSWGTDWGINGYIWLEMNHDTCGLTHEATWPSI